MQQIKDDAFQMMTQYHHQHQHYQVRDQRQLSMDHQHLNVM